MVNIQSSLRVWDSTTGSPLESGKLSLPYWYHVAYSHDGSCLVAANRNGGDVAVYAIPTAELIASFPTDLDRREDIAISADGKTVAVVNGRDIEVRSIAGELLLSTRHPTQEVKRRRMWWEHTLLFDGDAIVSHSCDEGWRRFDLNGVGSRLVTAPTITNPLNNLQNWQATSSDITLFQAPASEPIALPINGGWVVHPHDPRILACNKGQVRLHQGKQ